MTSSRRFLGVLPVLLAAALAGCDGRASGPTDAPAAPSRAAGDLAPLLAVGDGAIPGRYVVVLNGTGQTGTASAVAADVVSAYGGTVHYTYRAALNGFAATLSPAAVAELRANPQVKYVAEDGMSYPTQTTQTGATWGLDRIDQRALPLSTTYVYGPTGAGVRVYVIDTGILTTHAQFGTRASVGADFVPDGRNGQDCHGHGTHVAGTIAGTTYGVAKAAQVISVRVFGCTGGAENSTIIAAVEWVTAHAQKPAVANMSLGGGVYAPINQAVQASIASGVVYAVAAGNESIDACNRSPASTPEAITVGATTSSDVRSDFSNWGTCVDLFAPGTAITSAWWTSTTATNTINGTSMATPHVAGVAALYLQGSPTATPATVAAQLLATSSGNRLTDLQLGSPNRLLFSRLTVEAPAPLPSLNPTSLAFTFVRPVPGTAAADATTADAAPQRFSATAEGEPRIEPAGYGAGSLATATADVLSARVVLSNPGTGALNWTAASNQPWLTVDPASGVVNTAYNTLLNAAVDGSGLAAGSHAAQITVTDPAATPAVLNVALTVTEAVSLVPGTPRTALSGASASQRFFAVQVPAGATSLTIGTSGGTGDLDLYVRYGDAPTFSTFDCRPFAGGNVETCQVSSPLPGTYYVMLYGFSAYSGVTLAATSGGTPGAPASLAARPATLTSMALTWTDGSVNETSFTLARRMMTGDTWGAWATVATPAANAVAFTNTGLAGGGTYQYRLRACNAAGCSGWAESAPATLPTGVPAAPFGLVAVAASATSAQLTWTDASSDEAWFTLVRSIRNLDGTWPAYTAVVSPAANATGYTNAGLLAGRVYRWQLRACNAAGCSAATNSGIVTLPLVPAAPAAVAGTVLTYGTLRITWTDGSANETSFKVARAPVTGGVVGTYTDIATVASNATAFNSTGLAAGTYRYRIQACNLAGCSAGAVSANLVMPALPAAPTGLGGLVLSSTSLRVTWTDAATTETSYQVWRSLRNPDGTWPAYASVATLGANAVLFNNTGLLPGRAYRYQVRACSAIGCSAWVPGPVTNTPAS